jgi:hypothetical protein
VKAAQLDSACHMISFSAYSSALRMKAVCSSETSVTFQQTTGVISQKIVLFKSSSCLTGNTSSVQNKEGSINVVYENYRFILIIVNNELESMSRNARNLVYDTMPAFVWQRAYPEF